MRRLLLALCLAPTLALAQEDPEFIPYDEPSYDEEAPRREYDPTPPPDEADLDHPFRLSRLDDRNAGFAVEGMVGLFFGANSRSAGPDLRLNGGLRGTWEVGRMIAADPWREALLVDLSWWASGSREGTQTVFTQEALHIFTLAPAWNFPLAPNAPWAFFLQAGAGIAWQTGSVTTDGGMVPVAGIKPVIQYGLGLRARPQIGEALHLSIRLELTRFRRGYVDDTWLGYSMGLAF